MQIRTFTWKILNWIGKEKIKNGREIKKIWEGKWSEKE